MVINAAKAKRVEYTVITPVIPAVDTPPYLESPHTTRLPLLFTAAKASLAEYTATTLELRLPPKGSSPPPVELPQAITLPSLFSAAKAALVEYTATTPEFASVTLLGANPPQSFCPEYPHATTVPLVFSAAKA